MKNKIFIKTLTGVALFSLSFSVFADKGFKIDEQTSNSIKLSWDKDEKATYYQINYGTDPVSKSSETEALDDTSFEISGLESGKKYYFSLTGLDSTGTEIFKSEDLEISISGSSSEAFALKTLELKEQNILRVTFSKNIDASKLSQAEFKVESIADVSDYLKVKNILPVSGDKKSIDIEFDGNPTEGVEYKLVVLAIFDEEGNNIKFGVDSEGRFKGGNLKKVVNNENVEITSSNTNSGSITEPTNLNAAGPVEDKKEEVKTTEVVKTENKKVLTGTEVSSENIGKNVEAISENKENLPQTGPEVLFLLLLALLIPAGIYKFKN